MLSFIWRRRVYLDSCISQRLKEEEKEEVASVRASMEMNADEPLALDRIRPPAAANSKESRELEETL